MSKSKGNSIRPQETMEKYGTDALRFWAASSKLGEDLDYQEKDIVAGKKFVTKILNASNFVFLNLKYQNKMPKLEQTDKVFLTQLNNLINSVTKEFEKHDYAKAKSETEKFFWQNFTDNYLEIIKDRMYNGTKEEKESASYTLYHSLLTILKLMAPITPFITEEIYQNNFKKTEKQKSIHLEEWPKPIPIKELNHDKKIWEKLIDTIYRVRQQKSKEKKSMKAPILLTIPKDDYNLLKETLKDLKAVTNAEEITQGKFDIQTL